MFGANIIYSLALKWQCNKVHTGVILSLERLFVCLWSSSSRVVGYNSSPTEQIWVVGSPRRSHSWLRCTQASHQLPLPTILTHRLGLGSISAQLLNSKLVWKDLEMYVWDWSPCDGNHDIDDERHKVRWTEALLKVQNQSCCHIAPNGNAIADVHCHAYNCGCQSMTYFNTEALNMQKWATIEPWHCLLSASALFGCAMEELNLFSSIILKYYTCCIYVCNTQVIPLPAAKIHTSANMDTWMGIVHWRIKYKHNGSHVHTQSSALMWFLWSRQCMV